MDFTEGQLIRFKRSLRYLRDYCEKRQYRGYDPYDVLLSKLPFEKLGKWPPILAIQLFKRNPLNFRPLIGVPKSTNPKALGLFLNGYSIYSGHPKAEQKAREIFEKLLEVQTPVGRGMAWGYPFPWASPVKFLPAWSPTSVVTGFVAQGLDAYYRTYKDERALEALNKACIFLSEQLHHTEEDDLYAISYSTVEADFCYNASLLAAQTYALTYSHTGQAAYKTIALKALGSVLQRQKSDGSWNYSENLETGKQRVQIDFHQGFILDSILSICKSLNEYSEAAEGALQKGFEFYRERQFSNEGRAYWRLPEQYPSDIHHQAQGLITALNYFEHTNGKMAGLMAKKIALYTLEHFQDKRGFFYYRKHRSFKDRTSYMRWGNAWMFLALSKMLKVYDTKERMHGTVPEGAKLSY